MYSPIYSAGGAISSFYLIILLCIYILSETYAHVYIYEGAVLVNISLPKSSRSFSIKNSAILVWMKFCFLFVTLRRLEHSSLSLNQSRNLLKMVCSFLFVLFITWFKSNHVVRTDCTDCVWAVNFLLAGLTAIFRYFILPRTFFPVTPAQISFGPEWNYAGSVDSGVWVQWKLQVSCQNVTSTLLM